MSILRWPSDVDRLEKWRPDALIGWFLGNESAQAQVATLGIPIVNVLSGDAFEGASGIPFVGQENSEAGRLAADYFFDKGHRRFAYIGGRATSPSERSRGRAFRAALEERGYCSQEYLRTDGSASLEQWLSRQATPLAVFAHFDILAWEVNEACRTIGARVPGDVAVLGVDNDDIFTELARPKLSSIAYPWDSIGRRAADAMTALLLGEVPAVQRDLVYPAGVVGRASTLGVASSSDPLVAKSLGLIEDMGQEPLTVERLASSVGCSRRVLERRFRRTLGISPGQQIHRVRLRYAQHLLTATELTVKQIAYAVGFSSAERLSVSFRQLFHLTPTEWRRRCQ